MPSLTFLGAARTVTGSKYLLEVNSSRILVDCGLFQGLKELRVRNWQPLPVPAETIDAVVLTHAHIDHSGVLPRLFAGGFKGRVFCTPGTADLCKIVLPDAGRLAEEDAREANRHGYSKHAPALPLFTEADAFRVLPNLQPVGYDRPVPVGRDATVTFTGAGHLLGSAFVALDLDVNGGRRIVFSGDIGRYDRPVLPDPRPVAEADVLLVESTYGDRTHDPDDDGERLAGIVRETVDRGGKVIIPAFAIGRVEEIIYWLKRLEEARRIPVVPVFLDSPMAVEALKHYARRSNELDPDMQGSRGDLSAFMTRRFQTIATAQRSMELVDSRIPSVVISSSGMATGGRVLNHLRAALPNSRNTVLFSGYQAAGTRGRRLVDGEREVKIHGEVVPVNARIEQLHSMSAHADADELLRWLGGFKRPPSKTFVVHGEPETADTFASLLRARLGWQVEVPDYLDQRDLSEGNGRESRVKGRGSRVRSVGSVTEVEEGLSPPRLSTVFESEGSGTDRRWLLDLRERGPTRFVRPYQARRYEVQPETMYWAFATWRPPSLRCTIARISYSPGGKFLNSNRLTLDDPSPSSVTSLLLKNSRESASTRNPRFRLSGSTVTITRTVAGAIDTLGVTCTATGGGPARGAAATNATPKIARAKDFLNFIGLSLLPPLQGPCKNLRAMPRPSIALALAVVSVLAFAADAGADPQAVSRDALLAAEASRAPTRAELELLFKGATGRSAPLARQAVRALGRLERADLVPRLLPLLEAGDPTVRGEAASALVQAAGADRAAAAVVRPALLQRLRKERNGFARMLTVRSLGRLALDQAAEFAEVASALLPDLDVPPMKPGQQMTVEAMNAQNLALAALRGLESLIRLRAKVARPAQPVVDRLRVVTVDQALSPLHRRLALLALNAVPGGADAATLALAAADDDAQVRRLAAASPAAASPQLARAMGDVSPMVRYEALRVWGRRFQAAEGCAPAQRLVGDIDGHTALLAIDLLANCASDPIAIDTLAKLVGSESWTGDAGLQRWHRGAHAIVALAKASPDRARPELPRAAKAEAWQVRMYAANAAAALHDTILLRTLAADAHACVREAAIESLSRLSGHAADALYVEALGATDNQLVMTAARALDGTPDPGSALPPLLAALARFTASGSDTARDPRLALLERVRQLGSRERSGEIRIYLSDRDPRVAALAAKTLTDWTGEPHAPSPAAPRPQAVPSADEVAGLEGAALVVRVKGLGAFEAVLRPDEAPLACARVATLAAAGYYDGLTFHRIVPNFLIQGGSPGANEFVGHDRYMRDEVGATHSRGAIGISTRGRDTGDAQFYVVTVDVPRLDHDYTVFANVVRGMDVVDRVLEGAVIEKVQVVPGRYRVTPAIPRSPAAARGTVSDSREWTR